MGVSPKYDSQKIIRSESFQSQYDIRAIKQASEYKLRSNHFNFLPTFSAHDMYGFVWENERDYTSLDQAYSWFEEFLSTWLVGRAENKKHKISIESFIKKAALGPITLNMNKTEIESILGPPEIYCTPDIFGYKKATLWQYGNMEFHFSPDSEQLQIIDNHYTEDKQLFASESRAFELTDLFFFDGDVPLNSHELERKFVDADMNICYYRLDSEVSDTIKIKLESGVEFILEKNEDGLYVPNTIQLFDEASSIDPWTWIRLDWL